MGDDKRSQHRINNNSKEGEDEAAVSLANKGKKSHDRIQKKRQMNE
jgi:hypothetical protein